jgi:hypothetical protein
MPKAIEIQAKGKTKIDQVLWTVLLGDFVATYLGIINGVNPTEVDFIEKFKKAL